MKNILIILNFFLIIFIQNSFSQNSVCVPEAQRGYDKVDKLLEKAKSYGDKGNYNSEKKFAEKAVDLTLRIRKDYHCFSPRAFWKLSDANCHLGDFQSALKDAIKAYQECVDFKFDNCNFESFSEMKIGNVYLAMGNDSLAIIEYQKGLDLCKNGSQIIQAFLKLGTSNAKIKKGDMLSAWQDIEEAEQIAHLIGDTYSICQVILGRCYSSYGIILFQKGNCDEALAKFLTALQESESVFDRKITSICYFNIARIYDLKARYADALGNYNESIKIASQMGYISTVVDSYIYMAYINETQGNRDIAIKLLSDGFNIATKNKYVKGIVDAHNVKAFIDGNNNKFDDLLSSSKSALSLSKENHYVEGIADSYNNLETFYESKKEYKLAIQYAKLAMQTADSIGYNLVVTDSYNDFGDIYMKNGKLDSALIYYNIALNKGHESSYRGCGIYKEGIVDSHNKIGHIYKMKFQNDKALENYYYAIEISKEIDYKLGALVGENGIRAVKGLPPITNEIKK